jgi:hypothetical protein
MVNNKTKEVTQDFIATHSLVSTDNITEFYVYVVEFGGVIYYVGKGSKNRYKHVNSGVSGNKELNRLHFLGVTFNVYIAGHGLPEDGAFLLEDCLIEKLKPLYNVSSNKFIGRAGIKLKGLKHNNCKVCGVLFTSLNVLEGWKQQIIFSGMCASCDEPYGHRD